ncbi:MAG TPA: glycoside hydrolase family 15 protein [Patescibacteria group bacterium]|jgi:GH15 family glucan-1,4-alpha-glucosidase|nr:glycoside hydrolase family 15 protein [Patescibacteria group bacterium]
MGRPVILSNGQLTVGLNESGIVNDFYYPYVGLENLSNARKTGHKIGVWVENQFSWIDSGEWKIDIDFESDALVSQTSMQNDNLKVLLTTNDFVDHQYNVFCRRITITNQADRPREIRLFLHQVFEISRAGRADTALYVPDDNYILDYKGRYSLLIYGQNTDGKSFDQFAIGNYAIENKEGTYKDAEDGELSGSPVEHGGVDSVIRFPVNLNSGESAQIDYWIIAADSQYNAEKIQHLFKKDTLEKRLDYTRQYWREWLSVGADKMHGLSRDDLEISKKSLMIIKAHIDKRGGIIASCDSSIYNYGRDYYSYVWPRDGAYAIWPLIRLGYHEEAKRFFEFCRDILTTDGYLMHKYQPDRAIGSTWHPLLHGRRKELAIQEDETAIVVYMIGEYLSHTNDVDFVFSLYSTFIQPAGKFMASFIDESTGLPHASYDLWEEKFLTNTYTAAVTYQALIVAAELAEKFEYPDDAISWRDASDKILSKFDTFYNQQTQSYRKGFLLNEGGVLDFDETLDVSSMYGVMLYIGNSIDVSMLKNTVTAIEQKLLDISPSGGSPRYEHDHYFESNTPYMGNPWFVTTLWLAQYYIRNNQPDKARHYVEWTKQHALRSKVLSEQVNPSDGAPISVTPLIWSHAELLNTILDLAQLN